MPSPVGPAPRDPDDPDLWDEWHGDPWADEERVARRPRPLWVRLAAVVVLVGIVYLLVIH